MKKATVILCTFILFVLTIVPVKSVFAKDKLKVAIVQLVSHPSLDDITKGVYQGLEDIGYKEGDNLEVDFQNAQGDISMLRMISQQVVNQQPDLIFAITTPVAQVFQNATTEIPIVMTGITDPIAADLVSDLDKPGANITGASDQIPMQIQFEFIQSIYPSAQSIGLLYTSSEDNSKAEVDRAQKAAEELGYQVTVQAIHSATDMPMVARDLANQADALFIASDNTIAVAFEALLDAADTSNIPVFSTVDNMIRQGAVGGVAINQKDIGITAVRVAKQIIDGNQPAETPIVFVDRYQPLINQEVAEKFGIDLNAEALKEAKAIDSEVSNE